VIDESGELERVERVLSLLELVDDPVVAPATAVGRIAHAQAFTEGNERTALLIGRWVLDRNGIDGLSFMPEHHNEHAGLLLSAASGIDETQPVIDVFESRRK